MAKRTYEPAKYNGRWSVFDTQTRTFAFIGKGYAYCKRKADELNNMD